MSGTEMTVRVFTFSPAWGLPTIGPFALKLLAWLELAGIPYDQVIEDNPGKGPKKKNPWIELDGELIGDTEVIIELLSRRHGIDVDEGLSLEQRATGHAWRRMFEEHFHQVLEWELFGHPAGEAYMRKALTSRMPPVVGPMVFGMLRRQLLKQLHARGIARHGADVITAKGRADIDAFAAFLGDSPFLLGDRPGTADTAVFGQLAPMVYWPMDTPVAAHARAVKPIADYCERMRNLCFSKAEKQLEPA